MRGGRGGSGSRLGLPAARAVARVRAACRQGGGVNIANSQSAEPHEGVMVTDGAAAERTLLPSIILPPVRADLQAQGLDVIEIQSVYDVDGVDTAPGGIATVADGKTRASERPARFLRIVKVVSIPDTTLVNARVPAYAVYCGASGGAPFPDNVSVFAATGPSTLPQAGQTMGSACSELPSFDGPDVWMSTGAGLPLNPAIDYSYAGESVTGSEIIPTSATCESHGAPTCRVRINHPQHLQPIWDLPRTPAAGTHVTCSQGGCHHARDAGGAAAQPAGNLDLTSTPDGHVPQESVSPVDLLTQRQVAGPIDADGHPTVGPLLDAGNSNGMSSRRSLAVFASGSGDTIHAGLTPPGLRLICAWLDIGAQCFNNPFDPAVPVN